MNLIQVSEQSANPNDPKTFVNLDQVVKVVQNGQDLNSDGVTITTIAGEEFTVRGGEARTILNGRG